MGAAIFETIEPKSSSRPSRALRALSGKTIIAAGILALGSCSGTQPPSPIALSWRGDIENPRFAGYEALAGRVKNSYVRVLVLDPAAPRPGSDAYEGLPIVNGASGVIVDASGDILTAAHIAKNTSFIVEVTTSDGQVRPGRILDIDPRQDLALLRIAPTPSLLPAVLAGPERPGIGEPVLAIGTPDNKPGVVSLGTIVEPKTARRIAYENGRYGFDDGIKLHMEIEPGHSGGPVFDWQGRVIGLVGGFVLPDSKKKPAISPNLGYAIPADTITAYLARVLPPR
jgi:S1-C subfamily serine protease